jgi:hypothetical protein
MDPVYHAHRAEDQTTVTAAADGTRREAMNGASSNNARSSPTQSAFHHPSSTFTNPYHHQPPLPMPISTLPTAQPHIPGPPESPRTLPAYSSEYQPPSRDKPPGSYYDPTSDSGDRRPDSAGWHEASSHTPQPVRCTISLFRHLTRKPI